MADPTDETTRRGAPRPREATPSPRDDATWQQADDLVAVSLPQRLGDASSASAGPRVVPVLAPAAERDGRPGQAGRGCSVADIPHVAPPPAASGSVIAVAHMERPIDEGTRPAVAPATILIVENEESNRTLMEKILSFAGYQCVTACNGLEALDAFDRGRPDLVLTDIAMPVMDGYETAAHIRARPDGATIPIVAVTAHAMTGDREYALQRGCNAYLTKPYRPRELLEVVKQLLMEVSK